MVAACGLDAFTGILQDREGVARTRVLQEALARIRTGRSMAASAQARAGAPMLR